MADASDNSRELSIADVAPVLQLAVQEPPGLTLIGGQALNFWADRYLPVSPALQALEAQRPFVSGDLDFVGSLAPHRPGAARDEIDVRGELAIADRISRAVHGRLETKGVYKGASVTLAEITYRDDAGATRIVHFLGDMVGVTPVEVARTSILVRGHLRVMNPVLCMESRISNVLKLEPYQTTKGRHQARASIACAQEYVRELVADGHVREALDANERIFRFAQQRAAGCAGEGFRPFDAVLVDERLPDEFRTIRYPRMVQAMERDRGVEW